MLFRVTFALYAAGLAGWLILGLLPTVADLLPALQTWLTELAAGTGPLAAVAERILHPAADMTPVPAGQALLQYAFSVLNFALGLMLAIRAGSGRNAVVPRLLAFALLGTAATFNEPSHRAFHITGSPWPVATVHFAFHIISGVSYLWAVLLFPDGRLPRKAGLSPPIQRAGVVITTGAALAVGWRSSFLSHPQFFVVFFGICISLLGVTATALRLVDHETPPIERAASRLLCAALLPGLAVASFWCCAQLAWRLGVAPAQAWADWALAAFPAAFAVVPVVLFAAVQRYRLWDIDRLLGRVLVYGTLAAAISACYIAAVTAGVLVPGGSVWWVVLTLSLIAVAVEPARRVADRWVNRLVYGTEIGPTQAMNELLTGLEQLTPTAILQQLAAVSVRATRARQVALYAVDERRLIRVAAAPTVGLPAAAGDRPSFPPQVAMPSGGGDLDGLAAASVVIPVEYGGQLLGAVAATGDQLTAGDHVFLADIAGHAGLLLHNALLTELLELHVSALDRSAERLRVARRKLVAAQDLERERLERNLHDGAQQYLVAAIISLRAAGDVDRAADILTSARSDLVALAGGGAPPALSGGIAAALERSAELARRSGACVTVTVEDDRHRDDQAWVAARRQAEEAVYFCCAEAVQNAMKHAAARTITIHVRLADGDVSLAVTDDGRGFHGTAGSGGLTRLADRVGALGGWIAVESAPGAGTTMIGHIPVHEPIDLGEGSPPDPSSMTSTIPGAPG